MTEQKSFLVTGSGGQLAQSIKSIADNHPDYRFFFADRQQLNLSNEANINDFFKHQTFDVIINCAAYTTVDKAESETDLANQINHLAVKQLAYIAKQQGATLIHISTDYVFNGKSYRPYVETDNVASQCVYGQSKLSGEEAIKDTLKNNGIIIRTSWMYSEYGNNFVKTMLKLGHERDILNVIFDQVGTPTYAKDLAEAIMSIVQILETQNTAFPTSIFHFSNEGICSWYDFAKTIFELSSTQCLVYPIATKDFSTSAKRPHYSVLDKSKIKRTFDIAIPYWKDSLELCLSELKSQAWRKT